MIDKRPKFLDPRTLAELHGLRLRARQAVEGYVAGLHRSPLHGFSIEFAEHREYSPGDDLRHLDWKVFGRTDKFYLKRYEDETNLIAYIVVDTSQSMTYKSDSARLTKLEYAQLFATSLAWLVLHQQDAVGLATFDEQLRHFIQPTTNRTVLNELVNVLVTAPCDQKTELGAVLHELAGRCTRRGIVIILSDLFGDVPSLLSGLRHIGYRRHEVIVFHVLDPAELDLPFQGTTLFRGLEQFPELVVDSRSVRKAYLREFSRYLNDVQSGCRRHLVDYHRLNTKRPVDAALSSFLAWRDGKTA